MPANYKPQIKDRKRYEDRDGLTLAEVMDLAQKKNGWSQSRIAKQIGISEYLIRQWKFRGIRNSNGIPKLLRLTQLAGLSDAQAIVIILRHMIPVDLDNLKQYVGCTVRLYRKKTRRVQKRHERVADEIQAMQAAIPRAK